MDFDLVKCEKCENDVKRENVKRVFGQKDKYECKGEYIVECKKFIKEKLYKKNEQNIQIYLENNQIKENEFNLEYMDYINENKNTFVLLPS
jgi:hypothetical protein